MGEFELIEKFFACGPERDDVLLGMGDDAALVDIGTTRFVTCTLASVSAEGLGPRQSDPGILAHDLVCTAFNRLASGGIAPSWFTLALCLPEPQEEWVETFSRALFAAASPCGATLIGGDTTRGPLTATLAVHGAMRIPTGVKPPAPTAGDAVYLTGALGRRSPEIPNAAYAATRRAPRTVPPRVDEGITASAHVSAAADIRLSLAATLKRMLHPFELGVDVDASTLPVAEESAELARHRGGVKLLAETAADAELCFVVGRDRERAFCRAMATLSTPCTRIGVVTKDPEVRIYEGLASGT